MSKKRVASILVFNNKRSFKYPTKVVRASSGTGTVALPGIITVVAATRVYVTPTTTEVARLIGSA